MLIAPSPVVFALAGNRQIANGVFLLQATAKRVPALLVACNAGVVTAAVCAVNTTSEVAFEVKAAPAHVPVIVILTLKLSVAVAACAADTAKARVMAAANLVNFIIVSPV